MTGQVMLVLGSFVNSCTEFQCSIEFHLSDEGKLYFYTVCMGCCAGHTVTYQFEEHGALESASEACFWFASIGLCTHKPCSKEVSFSGLKLLFEHDFLGNGVCIRYTTLSGDALHSDMWFLASGNIM